MCKSVAMNNNGVKNKFTHFNIIMETLTTTKIVS